MQRGTGGQDPRRKEGSVSEAEDEGVGSGIPKVGGSGRKRENYAALCNIPQSKKLQRGRCQKRVKKKKKNHD